ncbi:MAG TPA: cytochrome c3 family protein [Blastocatellia bacterium]|nr:cytochrome c3 family protein [Blastocatellia bacterium]
MARKQVQALAFVPFFVLVAIVISSRAFAGRNWQKSAGDETKGTGADNCVVCHRGLDDQAVALYSKSAHAKNDFGCDDCHGGDPKATDKAAAHRLRFAGQPTDPQKLAMCGSCHATQLATFKTSLHAPTRANAPRMTCVECHGAHMVGSPARDFRFGLYCANCHGLEYLPALPPEFQKMLALVDEEKDLLGRLADAGRKPSSELLSLRREIRRGVAEIVHATDLRGGLERLPQIFKRGDEFKAMAERERK